MCPSKKKEVPETPYPPPLTPESFFREKVAPRFRQGIEEGKRRIADLERELQDRLEAEATVRVVIEGEGGGTWYLNIQDGGMSVAAEPAFPPLISVYQSYEDWLLSARGGIGFFAAPATARGTQGELTKSRIGRLRGVSGTIQFTLTDFPEGGERYLFLHFGHGERAAQPHAVVTMRAEDARKLARGDLHPQTAFLQGLVKITGDMNLAIQIGSALLL